MERATESSRRQHEELRNLAADLLAMVEDEERLEERAVQRVLSRLAGALKMHVAMEVEGLYPQLLAHPHEEVRTMATEMVGRVQSTYDRFLQFRMAWPPEAVHADHATFVREAKAVAQAFHASTTREEHGLYNRVDEIYAQLDDLRPSTRPPGS